MRKKLFYPMVFAVAAAALFMNHSTSATTVAEEGTWRWVDALGHCASTCQNPPYHCPCYEMDPIIVKG